MYHDGVFGVPFFVHGREKFWGLDRLETFAESIRSAVPDGAQQEPHAVAVAMAASDDGHAGGCG
jgi:hypothetical protein